MAKSNTEKSAGVIVFRTNHSKPDSPREYLLLDTGRFWDFPKGHIEADESEMQAALRELREEAGISDAKLVDGFCHRIRYFFRKKSVIISKTVVYFMAETQQQEIKISDEHVAFEFLSYAQARKRLTYANSRELLRLAEEQLRQSDKPL
jgi:8-oxo-dGTP pyrophosphatase MutT (NUDIX family)